MGALRSTHGWGTPEYSRMGHSRVLTYRRCGRGRRAGGAARGSTRRPRRSAARHNVNGGRPYMSIQKIYIRIYIYIYTYTYTSVHIYLKRYIHTPRPSAVRGTAAIEHRTAAHNDDAEAHPCRRVHRCNMVYIHARVSMCVYIRICTTL
jgi:hypothetical protein